MLTIVRVLRDTFLIFVTPVLVAMGIGYLVGDEEGGAWSVALVVTGWVLLLWLLSFRPAWNRYQSQTGQRKASA